MRRIRMLGLSAVLALALLALPAGASARGGLEADAKVVELTGKSSYPGFSLELVGGHVWTNCILPFRSGGLAVPASTVQAYPEWQGNCKAFTSNGTCKLELHPGTENDFAIGPPGCTPMAGNVSVCKFALGAQSGFPQTTTYTNVGEGSKAKVMIKTLATLQYKQESPAGYGCGTSGAMYPLKLSGEWEMTALNIVSGSPTGIRAVDGFGGFFLSGKASEEKAAQPRFEAESYSFPILGLQDPADKLDLYLPPFEGHVTCDIAEFDDQISGATADLAFTSKYSGCKGAGPTGVGPATVSLNGCSHSLGVDNAGPPYVGGLDLSCGEKVLEIFIDLPIVGSCFVKIPSQSLGSADYENLGEGQSRTVAAEIAGEGIDYSLTEIGFLGCGGKKGPFENGQLGGTLTLGSH